MLGTMCVITLRETGKEIGIKNRKEDEEQVKHAKCKSRSRKR